MFLVLVLLVSAVSSAEIISPYLFVRGKAGDHELHSVRYRQRTDSDVVDLEQMLVYTGEFEPSLPLFYNGYLYFSSGPKILRIAWKRGTHRHVRPWDSLPNEDGFAVETYAVVSDEIRGLAIDYEQNLGHRLYFFSNSSLRYVSADLGKSQLPVTNDGVATWWKSISFYNSDSNVLAARIESGGVFFLTTSGVQLLFLNPRSHSEATLLVPGRFTSMLTRRGPFYDLIAYNSERVVYRRRWDGPLNDTAVTYVPKLNGLPTEWVSTGAAWIDQGMLFFTAKSPAQTVHVCNIDIALLEAKKDPSVSITTSFSLPNFTWEIGSNDGAVLSYSIVIYLVAFGLGLL